MRLTRLGICLCLATLTVHVSLDAAVLPSDHTQWSEPVFRSAYKLIANAEEWAVLDTLSREHMAPYLRMFWKRRDPTPTTEPNEFREQFESRVDFAATNYRTVPQPAPWDPRGDLHIKLGPPGGKGAYQPNRAGHLYVPLGKGGPGGTFAPFTGVIPGAGESWYYYDYLGGQDLKVSFARGGMDMKLVPTVNRNLLDTTHSAYALPFGVKKIDMAFDWFPFRRVDGDYDVYIACATPLADLARRSDSGAGDLTYVGRVMAFDSTLQSVWSDSVAVELHIERIEKGMIAQHQWQVVLPAGFYMLAAEVEDPVGKKHSAGSFNRWLVPYADSVNLDLSPLVIAANIGPAVDGTPGFVRNGKEIMPMPGHVFKKDQDVYFYHELYDLSPDSTGTCYYRVEYSLYDRKKHSRRVLFSHDLASPQSQTFQAGKIPHAKLHRDTYILEANVLDLNAGTTRTALAQFTVK